MKNQTYKDIVNDELLQGNLDHDAYVGFLEDYRVLHCLMRKYNPKTVMEIGTNIGSGVNVIATALPDSKIYSLDLPYETMRQKSEQYPIGSNGEDRVGSAVIKPYTQLRGDSLTYDFRPLYPIEGWYIDSDHDWNHPHHETLIALEAGAKLIVWHDSDMLRVNFAIRDAMKYAANYELVRVKDTRIMYAVKKREIKY